MPSSSGLCVSAGLLAPCGGALADVVCIEASSLLLEFEPLELPTVLGSTFRFVPEPCAALDATCDDETFAADDETLVGTWEACVDDPGSTAGEPDDDGIDKSPTP